MMNGGLANKNSLAMKRIGKVDASDGFGKGFKKWMVFPFTGEISPRDTIDDTAIAELKDLCHVAGGLGWTVNGRISVTANNPNDDFDIVVSGNRVAIQPMLRMF